MATEKNITMKQFNGTDYDTLYPKTIGAQIAGAVPIASGGTNGTTAPSGVNNLVAGLSQIAPASNDLFPFRNISGNTGGSVTLANLAVALGNNGVITPSNLAAQASALGFAKIQTGSYKGTGTYGASHPCSLTFNFVPKIVIISCSLKSINTWQDNATTYEMEPTSFYYWGQKTFLTFPSDYTTSYDCTASISNKTLSWFGENSRAQLNYFVQYHPGDNFNETYTYIYYAIG